MNHPYIVWSCRPGHGDNAAWVLEFNDSGETRAAKPQKHLHYASSIRELALRLMVKRNHRDMLYIVPVYHTDREAPTTYVIEYPPRPEHVLYELAQVFNGKATGLEPIEPIRVAAQLSPGTSVEE